MLHNQSGSQLSHLLGQGCLLCPAIIRVSLLLSEVVGWALLLGGIVDWAPSLLRIIVQALWYVCVEVMLTNWAGLLTWLPAWAGHKMCSTAAGHLWLGLPVEWT